MLREHRTAYMKGTPNPLNTHQPLFLIVSVLCVCVCIDVAAADDAAAVVAVSLIVVVVVVVVFIVAVERRNDSWNSHRTPIFVRYINAIIRYSLSYKGDHSKCKDDFCCFCIFLFLVFGFPFVLLFSPVLRIIIFLSVLSENHFPTEKRKEKETAAYYETTNCVEGVLFRSIGLPDRQTHTHSLRI